MRTITQTWSSSCAISSWLQPSEFSSRRRKLILMHGTAVRSLRLMIVQVVRLRRICLGMRISLRKQSIKRSLNEFALPCLKLGRRLICLKRPTLMTAFGKLKPSVERRFRRPRTSVSDCFCLSASAALCQDQMALLPLMIRPKSTRNLGILNEHYFKASRTTSCSSKLALMGTRASCQVGCMLIILKIAGGISG